MHSTERDATQSEIEHYINMRVPSEFDDKPLAFWQSHEKALTILSKVAQVYLGISSPSVPYKCMFSTTEIQIGPEKLNRVVFIHDNFSLAVSVDECK